MSKSRRKASGCTRGRFKLKRMGKGWSTYRIERGREKPVDRTEEKAADAKRVAESGGSTDDDAS